MHNFCRSLIAAARAESTDPPDKDQNSTFDQRDTLTSPMSSNERPDSSSSGNVGHDKCDEDVVLQHSLEPNIYSEPSHAKDDSSMMPGSSLRVGGPRIVRRTSPQDNASKPLKAVAGLNVLSENSCNTPARSGMPGASSVTCAPEGKSMGLGISGKGLMIREPRPPPSPSSVGVPPKAGSAMMEGRVRPVYTRPAHRQAA
jgi:hypothetical protein